MEVVEANLECTILAGSGTEIQETEETVESPMEGGSWTGVDNSTTNTVEKRNMEMVMKCRVLSRMKKMNCLLHTVAACAIAALAVACSNDEESGMKPTGFSETITLTAYQQGSEANTRVGFDSYGNAFWHASDTISVWSSGDSKFKPFALVDGAGTDTASFRGMVVDSVGAYAVYPYNANHGLSGDTLTYYLPDSINYTSVDQTFFPEGKDGNSFCIPMYGTVSEDKVVSFKHIGGVVCFQIDKMPSASGTVTVTAAKNQLCGSFIVNLADEAPEIKTDTSSANKTVTFTFSNATKGAKGTFYLPVATGSYNLTIQVSGDDKVSCTTAAVAVTRKNLHAVCIATNYGDDNSKTINGHRFIDLGLPSGLLWAETNIGAKTAADDGDYYAWGETTTKKKYKLEKYKYCDYDYDNETGTFTKYTDDDGLTVLELSDDAAHVNWGAPCRMPTQKEFNELCDTTYCTWTWCGMIQHDGLGINGYKVTSKKNGNSIFLPASGYRYESGLYNHGSNDDYWSSTLYSYDTSNAYILFFYSGLFYSNYYRSRYDGRTVRPVAEP